MKIVAARAKIGSRIYNSTEFYCKTFFDVEAGQEVVVDVPGYGYAIAMISNVNINKRVDPSIVNTSIIQIIDRSQYENYIDHEKILKDLLDKMDRRVRDIKSHDLYERLAKEDEVLSSLLIDYKTELSKYDRRYD